MNIFLQEKKSKGDKDPNAPKRALSAYFLWFNASRESIKKKHPGLSLPEMAKKGGELWKGLSSDDKKEWEDKAKKAKDRYIKEMEEYKKSGGGSGGAASSSGREKTSKKKSSSPKKKSSGADTGGSGAGFKSKEFISDSDSSSGSDNNKKKKDAGKKKETAKPSSSKVANIKYVIMVSLFLNNYFIFNRKKNLPLPKRVKKVSPKLQDQGLGAIKCIPCVFIFLLSINN